MSTLPPEISREVKVVLLGDSAVGKTSLVFRFVTQTFQPNRDCTIGASFMTKTLSYGDNNIKFQIWDTAGQERYQGIAREMKPKLILLLGLSYYFLNQP